MWNQATSGGANTGMATELAFADVSVIAEGMRKRLLGPPKNLKGRQENYLGINQILIEVSGREIKYKEKRREKQSSGYKTNFWPWHKQPPGHRG